MTMTNNFQVQWLKDLFLVHITLGTVCVYCDGKGDGQGCVPLSHSGATCSQWSVFLGPRIPLLGLWLWARWQAIEENSQDHTSLTHVSLAGMNHIIPPRCKGNWKCSLVVHQGKGEWSRKSVPLNFLLYLLHATYLKLRSAFIVNVDLTELLP